MLVAVAGIRAIAARQAVPAQVSSACLDVPTFQALANSRMPRPVPTRFRGDVRDDIDSRLRLRDQHLSRLPSPTTGDATADAVLEKRRHHEAFLVAVAGHPAAAKAASERAGTAVLAYEWEGYSDGPLAEAVNAEAFLKAHPATAVRQGIELFLLHRYRCALEAGLYENDLAVQTRAAVAYLVVLQRSRPTFDVVGAAIADEIDGAPSHALHPRETRRDGVTIRPRRPELFYALSNGSRPPESTLSRLDVETRRRYEARVRLRAAYRPRLERHRTFGDEDKVNDHRPGLEGLLVAAAGTTRVAATAAGYAATAVGYYEYEGYSQPPLDEAAHAEAYLVRHPGSVLRPGLELYLLQRYRAAFEAADYEGNDEAQRLAAERYRTVWARVWVTGDPIIRAVARDIDEAEQVYITTALHPRTFGR